MKRILLLIAIALLGSTALQAQDTTKTPPIDSTLAGRDILSVMGPGAQIEQSAAIRQALQNTHCRLW